jgi:hypothetical protein
VVRQLADQVRWRRSSGICGRAGRRVSHDTICQAIHLRPYPPKGPDLARHSQDDLDAIALPRTTRPRVPLQGAGPLECFTRMIEFD